MRDSFVFYRSFFEAVSMIPEDEGNKAIKYILEYAFNDIEPTQKEGVAYALFCMAKPQIDANNQRFENGKKGAEYGKLGGRPRKNPKGVIEENPKGVNTKTPNVNDNVNDNENVNVNDNGAGLINTIEMGKFYPIRKKKTQEDVLNELDELLKKETVNG